MILVTRNSSAIAARFMAVTSSTTWVSPVSTAVATGPLPSASRDSLRDSEQNVLASPRTFRSAWRRDSVTWSAMTPYCFFLASSCQNIVYDAPRPS